VTLGDRCKDRSGSPGLRTEGRSSRKPGTDVPGWTWPLAREGKNPESEFGAWGKNLGVEGPPRGFCALGKPNFPGGPGVQAGEKKGKVLPPQGGNILGFCGKQPGRCWRARQPLLGFCWVAETHGGVALREKMCPPRGRRCL